MNTRIKKENAIKITLSDMMNNWLGVDTLSILNDIFNGISIAYREYIKAIESDDSELVPSPIEWARATIKLNGLTHNS